MAGIGQDLKKIYSDETRIVENASLCSGVAQELAKSVTVNMMTDCSLNYKFNTLKFQAQTWVWRTCCVQKFFLTFKTIFVHNMFSPNSAKRRASGKDLPVQKDCRQVTFSSP